MPDKYEPDEFDVIARSGGPVGVHRAPRKWYVRLLPPLIVFIAAGLLAFAIATYLWHPNDPDPVVTPPPSVTATPSTNPSTSPSTTASPTPSVIPSESAEPEITETADPEPVIIEDAQIHVRNAAGIAGLAGAQQERLADAGFTNIEANNVSESLIPDGKNTVMYTEDRLADTAAEVAATLGIDVVTVGDTPGGAEIEVLLATDPGA